MQASSSSSSSSSNTDSSNNESCSGTADRPAPPWQSGIESPVTYHKLTQWLHEVDVPFTESEHEAVLTSEEAASVRDVSLASGAKAMLLFLGSSCKTNPFVLAVLSAAKKINSKALKKVVKSKSLRFASPEEVYNLTSCVSGAVPPFGSLFGLKTYMDVSLQQQGDTINFNCGLRTRSVHMRTSDYIRVEAPEICTFAE